MTRIDRDGSLVAAPRRGDATAAEDLVAPTVIARAAWARDAAYSAARDVAACVFLGIFRLPRHETSLAHAYKSAPRRLLGPVEATELGRKDHGPCSHSMEGMIGTRRDSCR